MRVKTLCFSFLFLCFATLAVAKEQQIVVQNNDLYWLSYVENGKGVFLMQIDSVGNVVRAPVPLPRFGPTISLNGANKINVWGFKRRAVLDKNTLKEVKTVKTSVGDPISITQKAQHNFAAAIEESESHTPALRFFPVSPRGRRSGTSWVISSSDAGFCAYVLCPPGAVSSDGKTLFWFVRDLEAPSLYMQPLLDSGRPNGSQKLVGHEGEFGAGSVSNVLANGEVFVIYSLLSQGLPRQLFLQRVDAQTGQKIGDKILLAKKRFGFNPIAIDPRGRFVVYSYVRKKVHFLSFLALDATGHSSGKARVLLKKVDAYGIHLLKD